MFSLLKLIVIVAVLGFLVVHFWPDVSQWLSPAAVHKAAPYVKDGKQIIKAVSKS